MPVSLPFSAPSHGPGCRAHATGPLVPPATVALQMRQVKGAASGAREEGGGEGTGGAAAATTTPTAAAVAAAIRTGGEVRGRPHRAAAGDDRRRRHLCHKGRGEHTTGDGTKHVIWHTPARWDEAQAASSEKSGAGRRRRRWSARGARAVTRLHQRTVPQHW